MSLECCDQQEDHCSAASAEYRLLARVQPRQPACALLGLGTLPQVISNFMKQQWDW